MWHVQRLGREKKERDDLKVLGVNCRIILEQVLEKVTGKRIMD